MRTAKMKEMVIVGTVVIGLFVFWLLDERRSRKAVIPPDGLTNLVSFLEGRTNVARLRQFTNDGKVYVEVFAQYPPSMLKLRSGPPTYIFDVSGGMVDWTADRGDATAFVRRWGGLSNATFITLEKAKELVPRNPR